MKLHTLFIILLSTLILTFNGCGGGSSTTYTPVDKPTIPNTEITITDDYQVESLGTATTINATVSLGNTPKNLYLLLSNYATAPGRSTITHNAKVTKETDKPHTKSIVPIQYTKRQAIRHTPQYVQDFSSKLSTLLTKTVTEQPQSKTLPVIKNTKDVEGNTTSFCTNINNSGNCIESTNATARKVISDISTDLGTKTLNIWVSDDSFDSGSGCSKSTCVTQAMVEELGNSFLLAGENNDIYDWVTNIYGEEWETNTNGYTDLIAANNEITILLTDIDNDNSPDGGVVGFFWSKDNFNKASISGSNERVMLYIDSVMFANTNDGDFWQKEMYSTLAHEFQHMIDFYQKRILLDHYADTWISEMLSETTEDLIATKIKHIGPRGIEYTDGSAGETGNIDGRYPLFNENNTLSLTTWNNYLADYSKVNAFGAYLVRNYGGATLLHDIMHNTYEDQQAVVSAVNKAAGGAGKTFNNLLNEWGIAVILSDHDNLSGVPFYNTGDFMNTTYNGTTYEMGSINFFKYDPLPTIHTIAGTVSAQGNYYYRIGNNLTGDITINLELNGQTEATLIAK